MNSVLKVSKYNFKNIILSREFIISILVCIVHALLWLLFIRPKAFEFDSYDYEFSRLIYIVMVYTVTQVIRVDIVSNTLNTMVTGVISRSKLIMSKCLTLFYIGIIFSLVVEINYIFTIITLGKNFKEYMLKINHVGIFTSYILVTMCVGGLFLLLNITFINMKKGIIAFIVIVSTLNFHNSLLLGSNVEGTVIGKIYSYIPFYNISKVLSQNGSLKPTLIILLWSIIFILLLAKVFKSKDF